jgi:uncharacterized membrane protein
VVEPSAREALVPGIDQTRTVGLVTLPGAFIGVLLGGGTALEAGAAQVLVLVGLLAAQAATAAVVLHLVAGRRILREDLRALPRWRLATCLSLAGKALTISPARWPAGAGRGARSRAFNHGCADTKLGVDLILLTGCPKVLAHAAERKRAPGETKLGPPRPRRLEGVPGLKRTVTIAAPPEGVWSVVVDVDRWPERVPTVSSVQRLDEGPLVVGSRARLQQPRLPTAVWTVTELAPGRSFTWESSSPGVTVTASHVVESHPEGAQLTLAVDVSGPLSRMGWLMTRSLTEQYVETEASCMKRAAEAPAG